MRVTHILNSYEHRSEPVQKAAERFDLNPALNPDQRQVAMAYARLAQEILLRLPGDEDHLVEGLHQLRESRDSMIKSMNITRAATAIGLD